MLTRAGRTEDGTTVCDFEPEELKRQISVSLALAPFLYEDCKINIIDTPGYADFVAEVEAGLSVADLAVLVVSAVEGVWELRGDLEAGCLGSCSSTSSTASSIRLQTHS